MRPRFRLLLPVATATLAAALMLVSDAEQRVHDTRCDARNTDNEFCIEALNSPPKATPATIALVLVGMPGILLSVPFMVLEASLGESGIALHYVAWLVGIALFWNRVGAWFDGTLSDDPGEPKAPYFLVRFYFGCLLWLSPLVLFAVGFSSLSHHHANSISTLGVLMVWSGLGTFLLFRRFWNNNDAGIAVSTKQNQQT